MLERWMTHVTVLVALTGSAACASWDNPTALADLATESEFEIEAARVETFEETEIHVHVKEGGAPLTMREAELEIEHEAGGPLRVVAMEPEGDGYAAHVTFFEPGEHHLHFRGRAKGHQLMHEFGDHEIEVFRQHRVIGAYWVEVEATPAPVLPGQEAHIHFMVHELLPGDTAGAEVGGLQLQLEVHDPDGVETMVAVVENEPGEYEGEYAFGEAGTYELHLEVDIGGMPEEGEFHIAVMSEDEGGADQGGGGHGH